MSFLKLPPAPTREPIAVDGKGTMSLLFSKWLPWFGKLFDVINAIVPSAGTDNGDAGVTLTVGTSARTQLWNTPLTAPRTVTLSTANAHNGAEFEIVRTAAATGASGLDVGGLKTLATGQWCRVTMTDTGWILTAFGSL